MSIFFQDLNVEAFIEKPCPTDDLVAKIESIVGTPVTETQKHTANGNQVNRSVSRTTKLALLAEDEAKEYGRIKRCLERLDLQVELVTNGSDAVEQIILQKPDIIVMKRILSGMNGDKIAEVLTQLPTTQQIPIVLYDENMDIDAVVRFRNSCSNNIRHYIGDNITDDISKAVEATLNSIE